MKKIKSLLFALAVFILIPITVLADNNEKINVYIFRGEGCAFCAKALTFFDSLDDEYKSYFNLVEKEVWNDEANASDMQKVADYFDENVKGVPYIIIGDKTFQGYTEEYDADIKSLIKAGYENTDGSYVDVVAAVLGGQTIEKPQDDSNSAAITIIVILVAVAGVGFLIYMAREEDITESKEVIKEVVKKEEVKEPAKKATSSKKTSASKKTNTKKSTNTKKPSAQKSSTKKTTTNKK